MSVKVIDKKTIWEGRFLRTVILTYRDHLGTLRTWEAVERVNCDGITVIVPVTTNREFILIRQFRPVLDSYVIEFPAGLNNTGESGENTAARELIEETGFAGGRFIKLADGPVSSGMSTEILTVFLALDAVPATDAQRRRNPPDEGESIEIIRTPVEKIFETIEKFRSKGDMVDLKVYGIVELARSQL
jgi:8-oxo-dGTP pyrophosphatase MutT (NUDIX family)